jgi:hypothetical protein
MDRLDNAASTITAFHADFSVSHAASCILIDIPISIHLAFKHQSSNFKIALSIQIGL